jgi:Fic family protein
VRQLYKVFHEQDRRTFDRIYDQRVHFDSAMKFNLMIKPIDQPNTYNLYYIPTNRMLSQVSQIQILSRSLNNIFDGLPEVAQEQFLLECLVEELFNTNELEGVKSTKEEIAKSAREAKYNKVSKRRFQSMASLYLSLVNGKISLPKTPLDIRSLYDNITKGEIEENELPDGEVFRKEITYIYKKSGSGQIIHRGLTPESKIIEELEKLLNLMNDNKEIPMLIKAAAGHYFFGYIHPFYDGNGRTSRFISSMYMSSILGRISAMSLSRGCNKYRKQYLEAFEITNSLRNRGEMNHFIEAFFNVIIGALKEINSELEEKDELLSMAVEKIRKEEKLKSDHHRNIMFVIAQNYFFDFSEGLTIKDLSESTDLSEPTVRKFIKELLGMSLIKQKGKRPAYYTIDSLYFES